MALCPHARAEAALVGEVSPRRKDFVTGNTGIDAVLYVRDALDRGAPARAECPGWIRANGWCW